MQGKPPTHSWFVAFVCVSNTRRPCFVQLRVLCRWGPRFLLPCCSVALTKLPVNKVLCYCICKSVNELQVVRALHQPCFGLAIQNARSLGRETRPVLEQRPGYNVSTRSVRGHLWLSKNEVIQSVVKLQHNFLYPATACPLENATLIPRPLYWFLHRFLLAESKILQMKVSSNLDSQTFARVSTTLRSVA